MFFLNVFMAPRLRPRRFPMHWPVNGLVLLVATERACSAPAVRPGRALPNINCPCFCSCFHFSPLHQMHHFHRLPPQQSRRGSLQLVGALGTDSVGEVADACAIAPPYLQRRERRGVLGELAERAGAGVGGHDRFSFQAAGLRHGDTALIRYSRPLSPRESRSVAGIRLSRATFASSRLASWHSPRSANIRASMPRTRLRNSALAR